MKQLALMSQALSLVRAESETSLTTYEGADFRVAPAGAPGLFFEQAPQHSTLADDRQQGADGKLTMVGDRHRDRARLGPLLHDDVAASPPNLDEALRLEDPTHLASRQDAKPTHARRRIASQRCQYAGAA